MSQASFCQSCGMPMGETNELFGHKADGTKSEDYCIYCYDKGDFLTNETMEEMIESCLPHLMKADPSLTEAQARIQMQEYYPTLKRWA